jgi:hypothetical protein
MFSRPSRIPFGLVLLLAGSALAQTADPRTPEQLTVEAYRALMNSGEAVDRRFWAPERWYTRDLVNWATAYEKCQRRAPPIWRSGRSDAKLSDVDVTPVPTSGDEAQVLVSFKDGGRSEQRIFFFRRENDAWRIYDVMASGGRSLNAGRPACG